MKELFETIKNNKMKEFNLSEKLFIYDEWQSPCIDEEDVKEFIKRLKEVFNPQFEDDWAERQIDKLAGDKLK